MSPTVLFVAFIKDFLVPGSAWFLIIVSSIAVTLISFDRTHATGRRLLAGVVLMYWLMSVPVVAYGLQFAQRGRREASAAGGSLPPDALPIVALGNGLGGYSAAGARFEVPLGQTAMNTLFAVERFRRSTGAIVIASGGRQPGDDRAAPEALVIRDGLARNGIPLSSIVLEDLSTNTHEQAIAVSKILRARGQNRCVLVTSSQQMGRAVELFRREGIEALPLPAGSQMWDPSVDGHWWSWVAPSTEARAVSRDVIYELMAWPYYWLRGWVS